MTQDEQQIKHSSLKHSYLLTLILLHLRHNSQKLPLTCPTGTLSSSTTEPVLSKTTTSSVRGPPSWAWSSPPSGATFTKSGVTLGTKTGDDSDVPGTTLNMAVVNGVTPSFEKAPAESSAWNNA